MPFDPTKPANHSPNSSAEMRGQLNALKDLIDAIPAGPPGPEGPMGPQGLAGPQGPPGEVTQTDLNNAVLDMLSQSSANSNGVGMLSQVAGQKCSEKRSQKAARVA